MIRYKKLTIHCAVVILLSGNFLPETLAQTDHVLKGNIRLSGAFALYPLVSRWAAEFRKIHPEVRFDISAGGTGKGITDALTGMTGLGMASRNLSPVEYKKGAFSVEVARDMVIPVINASNPYVRVVAERGMTPGILKNIWETGTYKTWNQAFGTKGKRPIHVYTRSDAAGSAECWAGFIGVHQEDLQGIGIFGDPGLAGTVARDPLGIGYGSLAVVYNPENGKPNPGLLVIPFDINRNGHIDASEKIFTTINTLTSAIQSGHYNALPLRSLYFVSHGVPTDLLTVTFLKWILTNGQTFVKDAGYLAVPDNIRNRSKALLNPSDNSL